MQVECGEIVKQLALIISGHADFTPLLEFDALKVDPRTNEIAALVTMDETAHGIANQLFVNFRKLFQDSKTLNGVNLRKSLKDIQPHEQKARPLVLDSQESVWKEVNLLQNEGHF